MHIVSSLSAPITAICSGTRSPAILAASILGVGAGDAAMKLHSTDEMTMAVVSVLILLVVLYEAWRFFNE